MGTRVQRLSKLRGAGTKPDPVGLARPRRRLCEYCNRRGGTIIEERLLRSKRHLEHALTIDSSRWQAHRELITVAKGLSLPLNYMESHFQAAREIAPGDQTTYSHKHLYVQKKWYGTTELLFRFARECAESGEWGAGIPQM